MQPPELKGFMDKKLSGKSLSERRRPSCPKPASSLPAVVLKANRHVHGVLRGFDQFMNIVLDNAVDEKTKVDIGMVVRTMRCLPSANLLSSHAYHGAGHSWQ